MIFISNYKRKKSDEINSGIYCIINKINNKKYIGQTYDLNYRWKRHKSDLKNNRHSNKHLQSAWNKYGSNVFEFKIIEICNLDIIDDREIYWINYFDSKNTGYNLANGGLGCRGYKHTKEEIDKMKKIQNPKSVLQLSKDGLIIKKWDSASSAAKELDLFVLGIKNCCEQKKYVKSVGGFIWIYEEDKDNINTDYYFNIKSNSSKPIIQLDKNMNFVKRWESMYKINKELGLDTSSLSMVCNCKRNSCGGYIWKFEQDYIA